MREKIGLVLMLLILTIPSFRGAESLQLSTAVGFEDSNLEQCVRTELNIDSDIVSTSDLMGLTSLTCSDQNVSNLSGLENAKNLKDLNLSNNNITDISSLSSLVNLRTLDLSSNQIMDISNLRNLSNLTSLKISENKISDISSLQNLSKLQRLEANSNRIEDISSLSTVTDLRYLQLNHNQIKNVDMISNLTNLNQLLLNDNQITLVPSLSTLSELKQLSLSSNDITQVPDISATKISVLTINDNQVSSLKQLGTSDTLKVLNIANNKINSLDGLESLSQLEELNLSYNQLSDIDQLTANKQLKKLNLRHNQIQNINGLSKLKNLEVLNLSQNNIEQLSAISRLENLKTINVSENRIYDLSQLKSLGKININAENQVIILEPKVVDTEQQLSYTIKGINNEPYVINFNIEQPGTLTYKNSWNSTRTNNNSFSGSVSQEITYSPANPIDGDNQKSINEQQALSDKELIDLFNVKSKLGQKINVDQSAVKYSKPGKYEVVFSDQSNNQLVTSLKIVDVKPNITTKTDRAVIDPNRGVVDYWQLYAPTASEISTGDLNDRIIIDATAVNFQQAGTYNVVFKVSDDEGNIATKEVDLVNTGDNNQVIISSVDPDVVIEDGFVRVYKQSASGSNLDGFEYTIYDEAGNIIEVIVTDENGFAESEKLRPGHYYIELTGTPDNSVLATANPKNNVCGGLQSAPECQSGGEQNVMSSELVSSEVDSEVLIIESEDVTSDESLLVNSEEDNSDEFNSVFEKKQNNRKIKIGLLVLLGVVAMIFFIRVRVKKNE